MVNLFIPSQMRWKGKNIEVRQTTDFPEDGVIYLSVKTDAPADFTLSVRCPAWADKSTLALAMNSIALAPTPGAEGWIDVKRVWNDGDVLKIILTPRLTVEFTRGGKFVSFYHGPILLAAGLGTDGLLLADFHADGSKPFIQLGRKELPTDQIPALRSDSSSCLSLVGKRGPNGIQYPLKTTLGERELVPFYRIGLERYSIYFPLRP